MKIEQEHYFTAREGVFGMLASDGVPVTEWERANAVPEVFRAVTFCVLVLEGGAVAVGHDVRAGRSEAHAGREAARRMAVEQAWTLVARSLMEDAAQGRGEAP